MERGGDRKDALLALDGVVVTHNDAGSIDGGAASDRAGRADVVALVTITEQHDQHNTMEDGDGGGSSHPKLRKLTVMISGSTITGTAPPRT